MAEERSVSITFIVVPPPPLPLRTYEQLYTMTIYFLCTYWSSGKDSCLESHKNACTRLCEVLRPTYICTRSRMLCARSHLRNVANLSWVIRKLLKSHFKLVLTVARVVCALDQCSILGSINWSCTFFPVGVYTTVGKHPATHIQDCQQWYNGNPKLYSLEVIVPLNVHPISLYHDR